MPNFSPDSLELRGEIPKSLLSQEQTEKLLEVEFRVSAQLNWVAQLLGWSGENYWNDLADTIAEKRRLLGGSFGVYGLRVYPEVLELRNWNFSVLVEWDDRIKAGQTIRVGDIVTNISSLEEESGRMVLFLSDNKENFFEAASSNNQIFVETPEECPSPFFRPEVEDYADYYFHCEVDGTDLILCPGWTEDSEIRFLDPVFLFKNSRVSFDAPVFLTSREDLEPEILPSYDQDEDRWYLDIPTMLGRNQFLVAPNNGDAKVRCFCISWDDPSDWLSDKIKDNFKGVWAQKGGKLPLHFVFDSLGVHGFDLENSYILDPVEVSVGFNELLDYVYYKKAKIGEGNTPNQVWWDPNSGSFYVWNGRPDACSPWVEVDLPNPPEITSTPEYVFSSIEGFVTNREELPPGTQVELDFLEGVAPWDNDVIESDLDGEWEIIPNLGATDGYDSDESTVEEYESRIIGVGGALMGEGSVRIYKSADGSHWVPTVFYYETVGELNKDEKFLPFNVRVVVKNADSLGAEDCPIKVSNLGIEINKLIPVTLIKDFRNDEWKIIPNNNLKYVGDTRLFLSGNTPVDGEIVQTEDRLSIYYYNRWVDNGNGDWVLEGDWVDISTGESTEPPSDLVNYNSVVVYCNGNVLTSGETLSEEDYVFSYLINPETGNLEFSYQATTLYGRVGFPLVEISDSVSGAFRFAISDLIFGGAPYRVVPDLRNSQEPLRVWKEEELVACSDPELLAQGTFANPLVAGMNLGPATSGWNKYHIRLPVEYRREGKEWRRAQRTCDAFCFGSSDTTPESMTRGSQGELPEIYEDLILRSQDPSKYSYVYSEPYLFSGVEVSKGYYDEPWKNSALLPGSSKRIGNWAPSNLESYDPHHNRRVKEGGEWAGQYAKIFRCNNLTGFFGADQRNGAMEVLEPPVWDASIYKYPTYEFREDPSYSSDPNDYRVEYAMFIAGLSVAGDSTYSPLAEVIAKNPLDGEMFSFFYGEYQTGDPPSADPEFSSVALLLRMDGETGSTEFIDESTNELPVNVYGDSVISSARGLWGGTSGYFDGDGDHLQIPDGEWLDLSGGGTVELRFSAKDISGEPRVIIGNATVGSNFVWAIGVNAAGFTLWMDHTAEIVQVPCPVEEDTWYALALTYDPLNGVHVFFDGKKKTENNNYVLMRPNGELPPGFVGYNNPEELFSGYVEDVRVSKGEIRFTADYELENSPPPDFGG
ncbi:concanavalin A-like lectin/glucanase superfamily protein [Synechococcus phage S-CBWM1]|uniref:Concanavalin A-like lectin/glucanase superfamily protein n=1 Tax=Synechococcus phage S-CBWM1 TaxID=2053653 RepID=A0A3G1L3L5_9CAUD|nr:concanavalin A-like lectin/glucanase superfamily protein [Synechococcus phage S-CBWM1]ATW62768.1 concanavalin A-like lectin/glucanase superfamily protein [Synechococcus phage S-CBWM1]